MEALQVKLNFDADAHIYSDDRGVTYTSATTLIGKYKPPFDKRYWSMYTALKNAGCRLRPFPEKQSIQVDGKFRSLDSLYKNPINSYEVRELVQHWEDLTVAACERGNEVHDYLEDSINLSKGDIDGETNKDIKPTFKDQLSQKGLEVELKSKHDLDKTTIGDRFPMIYNRLLAYINKGCTIYAEKKVYSTKYEIAGMIDVLIVHLPTKQFVIMDWKTNKDVMMFVSGYFKKQKVNGKFVKTSNFIPTKKKLFAPINNLDDCKGMIYSLQLSLYAYIMELWGFKLVKDGLEIFHMRPNMKPQLIKIDYKREEIIKVLEHHYNTRILKRVSTKKFGLK